MIFDPSFVSFSKDVPVDSVNFTTNLKGFIKSKQKGILYVGTGGDVTLHNGGAKESSRCRVFKNVPDGSFLPVVATYVIWQPITFVAANTSLSFTGTPTGSGDNEFPYEVDLQGGSGTGLAANINMTGTNVNSVVTINSKDGYLSTDVLTVPANWDGNGASSFTVSLTGATQTLPGTTASDIINCL